MYWYGTASFFNNCPSSSPGGGACGLCQSNLGGVAYPSLNGFPGDYAASCTDQFGGLPALSCGDYLPIWNQCSNYGPLLVEIADHGPGAACTLDNIPCGNPIGSAYRLLDLTPVSFADLGGDPNAGLVWSIFQT